MRRFNTIMESANPPGTNQLWIDKGRLRYFNAGSWQTIAGGGGGGSTPEIGPNGNWYIDGIDTGKPSRGPVGPIGPKGKDGTNGQNGTNGQDGQDGLTPFINTNKNWWIGNIDTGILAEGRNGIDGAKGDKGDKGDTGQAGLDGKDGINGTNGVDGKDGLSAGFGEPVATAESVIDTAPAEVVIASSGPDTAKVFTFHFKIPKGKDGTGGGGTTDYNDLTNKPKIGTVELSGTKTLAELGIQPSGDYATKTEVSSSINTALTGYATQSYVNTQIQTAIGVINTTLDEINGEVI